MVANTCDRLHRNGQIAADQIWSMELASAGKIRAAISRTEQIKAL